MTQALTSAELLEALKRDKEETSTYSPSFKELMLGSQQEVVAPPAVKQTVDKTPNYEQMYEDAKAQRASDRMFGGIMRASALANEALAGTKLDKSAYEDIVKNSDEGISDIKGLQSTRANQLVEEDKLRSASLDKETADPTSSISQASRERIKKAMPEVGKIPNFNKLSAAQLEKLGFKNESQSASFQQTRYVDPVTNEVKIGLFNNKTGQIIESGRTAGFANQFREDPRTKELISLSPSDPRRAPIAVTGPNKLVNSTTSPVSNTDGGPLNSNSDKTQPPPSRNEIFKSLTVRGQNSVDENTKLYLKDTEGNRKAVFAANSVRSLLQATPDGKMDYDILRAIQNQLARGNGEVGAMTENDVQPYGGRPTLLGKINRFMQMQSVGQLPPEDRKLLSDLSQIMEVNARGGIKMQSQPYVANIQRDTGLDDKNAFLMLGGQASTLPRIDQPQTSQPNWNPDKKARLEELKAKLGKK